MRAMGVLILALVIMSLRAEAAGLKTFSVDAHGGRPNRREDSAAAFRAAIAAAAAAGGGTVTFGPGKYYMMTTDKRRAYAAWPRGVRNVHITGVVGKTELIVTDPSIGLLRFDRSTDCSLRNVICDYETPPFTQGKIIAIDSRLGTFDLTLDEGFPAPDAKFFKPGSEWGMPIHPTEPRPKYTSLDHMWIGGWSKVTGRSWRLKCRSRRDARVLAVGDRFVLLARQQNPTIFALWNCSRVVMADIVVHASPGITNGVVMCDRIVYRRFQVRFRKGTKRVVASNGDGIHVHGNRGGPLIEDCFFEGLCDDGVNLNSHMNPIVKAEGRTLLVDRGPVIFKAGDRLQIVDPDTGGIRATVKCSAVKLVGRSRAELTLERAVAGIKVNAPAASARGSEPPRKHHGPVRTNGDVVYCLGSANADFIIRRNTFRGHRRHGLLIRSGKGVIEDNTFDRLCGNAITIQNDPPLEGPVGFDVVVRNNTIVGTGRSRNYGDDRQCGSIMIRPNRVGHRLATARPARNITITGNTITDPQRYGIYVGAADGVTIASNTVTATATSPTHGPSAGICIENAIGVVVRGFAFTDPRKCVEAGIVIRRRTAAGSKGVTIERAKMALRAGVKDVLDLRD